MYNEIISYATKYLIINKKTDPLYESVPLLLVAGAGHDLSRL
jgi:hypothetical protein